MPRRARPAATPSAIHRVSRRPRHRQAHEHPDRLRRHPLHSFGWRRGPIWGTPGSMLRRVLPLVAVLSLGLAACGTDDAARMRLTTPPEHQAAAPLPEVAKEQADAVRAAKVRPTQADAERTRPVLRGWANALRRNDDARAAQYFSLPAIVAQGTAQRLETRAQVKAFNVALPCGARLLGVGHVERYVVGTFRLTVRPDHVCTVKGRRVRVAFVMRGHKIAEWREVPNIPGAPIGPDAPEDAPPLPVKTIA